LLEADGRWAAVRLTRVDDLWLPANAPEAYPAVVRTPAAAAIVSWGMTGAPHQPGGSRGHRGLTVLEANFLGKVPDSGPGGREGGRGARPVEATLVVNLARRRDRWEALEAALCRRYHGFGLPLPPTTAAEGGQPAAAAAEGAVTKTAVTFHLGLERVNAVDGRALFSGRESSSSDGYFSGGDASGDSGLLARVARQFTLDKPRAGRASQSGDWAGAGAGAGAGILKGISRLNPHEDHGWRPAVIGCALSHLKAWRRVAAHAFSAQDIDADLGGGVFGEREDLLGGPTVDLYAPFLILEDDVELSADFAARFEATMRMANAHYGWDIIFLGVLDDRDMYGDAPAAWSCIPGNMPASPPAPSPASGGLKCLLYDLSSAGRSFGSGLFGYVLRPRAARALLRLAAVAPITQPIDWWLWETLGEKAATGGLEKRTRGVASDAPPTGPSDPRGLGRLVGLKASPPLAASPEGIGRDSDNDELYAAVRLNSNVASLADWAPHTVGGGAGSDLGGGRVLLRITYPPAPGEPFYLPLEDAAFGLGRLAVAIEVSGVASTTFLEVHKLDRICVAVAPHGSPGGDPSRGGGGPDWVGEAARLLEAPQVAVVCRALGDADLRLPKLTNGPGAYRAVAFVEPFATTSAATAFTTAAVAALRSHPQSAGTSRVIAAASPPVSFEVTAGGIEAESLALAVGVDGQTEALMWRPALEACYAAARAFCVGRLGLERVDAATACVDQVTTRLLETRRQARGLSPAPPTEFGLN